MSHHLVTQAEKSTKERAEEALIGAILDAHGLHADIFDGFEDHEAFSVEKLSHVFEAALIVYQRGHTPDAIAIQGELENIHGYVGWFAPHWHCQFEQTVYNPELIGGWKREVLNGYRIERFKQGAARAQNIDDMERTASLALESAGILSGLDEPALCDAIDRFLARQRAILDGSETAGLPWGADGLDALCTMQPGCLYVMAGLKKCGKTQLMMATVRRNIADGVPCFVFSIEMSYDNLLRKIAAHDTGINSRHILSSNLTEGDMGDIDGRMQELKKQPLHVNQSPSIGIAEIMARARSWKRSHNIKDGQGLITVDYLQLINYEHSKRNEASELKTVAYQLARLAKELQVPLVAIAQFRNEAEGQRPHVRFIEGSGGIAQAAEGILLLDLKHRTKGEAATEQYVPMDVYVDQRNGESGQAARLEVDLSTGKFETRREW